MKLKIEGKEIGLSPDFALTFTLENAFFDDDLTVKHRKYSYPTEIPLSAALRKQLLHKNSYKNNSILPSTLNARLEDGVFGKNYTLNVLKAEEYFLRGSVSDSTVGLYDTIGADVTLKTALTVQWSKEYSYNELFYTDEMALAFLGKWINNDQNSPVLCVPVVSRFEENDTVFNEPCFFVWSDPEYNQSELIFEPDTLHPFFKIGHLLEKAIESCGFTLHNNIFKVGQLATLLYVVPFGDASTYINSGTAKIYYSSCVPDNVLLKDFIEGLQLLFNFRIVINADLNTATIIQANYSGISTPLNIKRTSISKAIQQDSSFWLIPLYAGIYEGSTVGSVQDGTILKTSTLGILPTVSQETITQRYFTGVPSNPSSYNVPYTAPIADLSAIDNSIPFVMFANNASYYDTFFTGGITHNYYLGSLESNDNSIRLTFNASNGLFALYHQQPLNYFRKNQNLLPIKGYLTRFEALQLNTLTAYEYDGIKVIIKSGNIKIPSTGKAYVDLILCRI